MTQEHKDLESLIEEMEKEFSLKWCSCSCEKGWRVGLCSEEISGGEHKSEYDSVQIMEFVSRCMKKVAETALRECRPELPLRPTGDDFSNGVNRGIDVTIDQFDWKVKKFLKK
jgi:hypothetical protein